VPQYTYKCNKCQTVTNTSHRMTEDPEIRCYVCDQLMSRIVISVGGIRFNGQGFYSTDKG